MNDATLEDIRRQGTAEVEVDDYGFTGEGYVRLEDGWLSIPGALPGEVVRVSVDPEDEAYGHRMFATLEKVVEPSDRRIDPLCEVDDVCRGCQLRHMNVDEELRFKRRTVREVVEKFADLSPDEQPDIETITPWPIARGDAFRIRSGLNYRRIREADADNDDDNGADGDADGDADEKTDGETDGEADGDRYYLGLISPVRPAFVPMGDCPALTGAARRLVSHVEATFAQLEELPPDREDAETGIRLVEVGSTAFGRGLVDIKLTPEAGKAPAEAIEEALREGPIAEFAARLAERLPDDVGVAVDAGECREHVKPPERVVLPLEGLRLVVGYDDWFPATITPTEAVYQTMLEWLDPQPDQRFLDVGSGIGTISLLVAPTVQSTTGIDINRHSVETAELNAVRNGRENVNFMASGWEKALRKLALDDQSFEIATINPMREPLGERALAYLDRLGLRRLVYLGPSPAAAAKDLGHLRRQGWNIDALAAGNVHPATYHCMLVARLERH